MSSQKTPERWCCFATPFNNSCKRYISSQKQPYIPWDSTHHQKNGWVSTTSIVFRRIAIASQGHYFHAHRLNPKDTLYMRQLASHPEVPDVFRALKQPGFETPKHLRVSNGEAGSSIDPRSLWAGNGWLGCVTRPPCGQVATSLKPNCSDTERGLSPFKLAWRWTM